MKYPIYVTVLQGEQLFTVEQRAKESFYISVIICVPYFKFRGDWGEVWRIANANKGVIFGVVLPLVMLLRFPALTFMVGRIILSLSNLIFVGLISSGNIVVAARWLWVRIVAMAKERNKRRRP